MFELEPNIGGCLPDGCRHQLLHQEMLGFVLSVAHGHRGQLVDKVSSHATLLILVNEANVEQRSLL